MKRLAVFASFLLAFVTSAHAARASWLNYYCAVRNHAEAESFWAAYYKSLQSMDWTSYYYQGAVAPAAGGQRVQFAPPMMSPTMQWAVPNTTVGPPPVSYPPYPSYPANPY